MGATIWFTGLPGTGKTTLAAALHRELLARGRDVEHLDGDDVRHLLSPDLGFSKADRDLHVHRLGYVAHLLARHHVLVLVSAIAPYRAARDCVRRMHDQPFIEVWMRCPVDVLVQRDPKGLYARALRGELPHFTGISDPYEPPLAADVEVHTDLAGIDVTLALLVDYLEQCRLL